MNDKRRSRPIVLALALNFSLLALNYGFDWWRRLDFTRERMHVADELSHAGDLFERNSLAAEKSEAALDRVVDTTNHTLDFMRSALHEVFGYTPADDAGSSAAAATGRGMLEETD